MIHDLIHVTRRNGRTLSITAESIIDPPTWIRVGDMLIVANGPVSIERPLTDNEVTAVTDWMIRECSGA